MSTRTMTAGKTAEAVIIHSDSDRVIIEITGSAFDNLKKIAAIHNSWNSDEDLGPQDIVERYLLNDAFDQLPNKKADSPNNQTLCGVICEYFANITDATADEVRRLANNFETAGFDVQ